MGLCIPGPFLDGCMNDDDELEMLLELELPKVGMLPRDNRWLGGTRATVPFCSEPARKLPGYKRGSNSGRAAVGIWSGGPAGRPKNDELGLCG